MECIFCRIVKKEIPCEPLLETEDLLAFEDIQPSAPVHILIIPKRHIATLNDLEAEDKALAGKMILAARDLARDQGVAESGYRLVTNCNREGGQEVFHLHMHLLGGRSLGRIVSGP
jgi:histidine triad (HIT) family protein